jgi:hypothetical protein
VVLPVEESLIIRRTLQVQVKEDDSDLQTKNIFHTRCYVENKTCSLIIDSGSCTSMARTTLLVNWTCGHARYKPRTNREKTFVAYRKLRYFSITSRLQRLSTSPNTPKHMTCHHSYDAVDGVMVHPSDGEVWKHFNKVHPQFSFESKNIRLGLCTYKFNPFESFTSSYYC